MNRNLFLATIVGIILFFVVVIIGIFVLSGRSSENCRRIHTVVLTLDDIMQSQESNIRDYVREGTLTASQGARALEDNKRARLTLGSADCPVRNFLPPVRP